MAGKELRHINIEIRTEEGEEAEERKVAGIGIIYDDWSELWPGYRERIRKGAVQKADVVKSYFNHDPDKVLATTRSKPALELRDGKTGMEFITPIPPTSYGNDLAINLERGNVTGASFAFSVPEDGDKRWDEDGVFYRDIKKLTLYEIGPVSDPAYISTSAQLRCAEDILREMQSAKTQEGEKAEEQQRKARQEAAERSKMDSDLLELVEIKTRSVK